MPVIAVNLTPETYDRVMKTLVAPGSYSSLEQFLEIAVFNQLALEDGSKPEEILARGHRRDRSGGARSQRDGDELAPGAEPASRRPGRREATRPVHRARRAQPRPEDLTNALARFALEKCGKEPERPRASVRPKNERIWGQVNRLFPLKLVCRWLSVAHAERNEWSHLEAVEPLLSADAAAIGTLLEEEDAKARRKRDDQLATGLPRRGNLPSQDRFMSQIVARTTRAAAIYPGAVCHYALGEFHGDVLALTDRGADLASLRNPVLDEGFDRAATTLSDDERRFFVQQVLQFVPSELADIRLIISAVVSGSTTPEAVLAVARPSLPDTWSETLARTHVSGVVARLVETGLLRRQWEGRNVTYQAGALATTLLA